MDGVISESDVEQKLVFPLLTRTPPQGLGIPEAFVLTKHNTRRIRLGKGPTARTYFPDYLVQAFGIPVAVVEAKAPSEDLAEAFREARLYAAEINSMFPTGFNPVQKQIVANGVEVWIGNSDFEAPLHKFTWSELSPASDRFRLLSEFASWKTLDAELTRLAVEASGGKRFNPKRLLGGDLIRNQELPKNSFGETVTINVRNIFNPRTWQDRREIVLHAYVPSKSRLRYIDPIDKIVRAARPPSQIAAREITDSSKPIEVLRSFKNTKALEAQVILLVGQVGAGKTTFVDYLQEVAIPAEVQDTLVWCRINLNNAPLNKEEIYKWLCQQVTDCCRRAYPQLDFDALETMRAVFAVEVNQFEKGVGKLYSADEKLHSSKLAEHLEGYLRDPVATARAHVRYCCAERQRLLVAVLDNCDKRERDDQLLIFQAAHWVQTELRTLVIMPIREETYDNHRREPPLDTAIKDFVFRIEPPLFQQVLIKRVNLAMKGLGDPGAKTLKYDLPNGFHVEYPATDQAFYLTSIVNSVFEHDRFLRRMIAGLAGADVRKALEIFIAFCKSGHIGEDTIFRIRHSEGKYALPPFLVARVLLRLNRRYYDSSLAYLKNLFATEPGDMPSAYFARLACLRWLEQRFHRQGPSGIAGYFPVRDLKRGLEPFFDRKVIDREIRTLIEAQTVIAEHLRTVGIEDDDLVRIAPAGFVHLDALSNIEYLAAVCEDMWFSNKVIAETVAGDMADSTRHFLPHTAIRNAETLVGYLNAQRERVGFAAQGNAASEIDDLTSLEISSAAIERLKRAREKTFDPWYDAHVRYKEGIERIGRIANTTYHGVFIELETGITGLAKASTLPGDYLMNRDFIPGEWVIVRIARVRANERKIDLVVVSTQTELRIEDPLNM